MKSAFLSTSAILLALAVTGCATEPPQALKPTYVPSSFTAPISTDAPLWPQADWWKGFDSDELNGLIATAQTNNLDLANALGVVLQAEGSAEAAGAPLFPQIGLDAGATRARSTLGGITTGTGTGVTIPLGKNTSNSFNLGGSVSWALDIWGEAQDNLRAANEQVKSSRYAQEGVALTVTAGVGTTYLNVLALRERVTIAQANIDAAKRILNITQAKVTNGVSSRLDLAQQEAQVDTQEASIPPLIEAEREARYALAILLGQLPEGFDVQAKNLDAIVGPTVKPGLPSELLRRRPDVAQAEANLAAAHANVDAARAAFFPQIGLSGSSGYTSGAVSSLIRNSNFEWSIGASLLQTIFDGGTLEGNLHVSKAQQIQLVATYRKTVLSAFSDVETSLGQVASLTRQEKLETDAANAAAEAFKISEIQYREGVTDLLTVLTAQQTLFTAQDQLVQIKSARLQADINLFKALGGGWTEADEEATQAIPTVTTPVTPSAEPGPGQQPASKIPTTPGPTAVPGEPAVTPTPPRRPHG
jgi:NodT family efflux transporter outer membrane factor (OMF) lipoprotein